MAVALRKGKSYLGRGQLLAVLPPPMVTVSDGNGGNTIDRCVDHQDVITSVHDIDLAAVRLIARRPPTLTPTGGVPGSMTDTGLPENTKDLSAFPRSPTLPWKNGDLG